MKVWVLVAKEFGYYDEVEFQVLGVFSSYELAKEEDRRMHKLHHFTYIHESDLEMEGL